MSNLLWELVSNSHQSTPTKVLFELIWPQIPFTVKTTSAESIIKFLYIQVNSTDKDDNNKNNNLCDGICWQNPYFHLNFVEPQGSMQHHLGNSA